MLKKGTFLEDALKIVTGTLLSTIIAILTAPVITRLYSPTVMGISTLFFSITAVIGVIACLRYEPAIILSEDDEVSANVIAVCLVILSLIFIGTFFIVIFWSQAISEFFRAPMLSQYLWLLPFAVFLVGLSAIISSWNAKKKHFGYFPIISVINEGCSVSAQIGAGLSGYTTSGSLIAGNLFGNACSYFTFLALTVRDSGHFLRKSVSVQGMRKAINRYRKFPLIDTWSTLLNNVFLQLPVFMLSRYFSSSVVGLYGLAALVVSTPAYILGGAISGVFLQRAARLRGNARLRSNIEQLFGTLVTLGLFPTLVVAITGADLFSVVFSAVWREAGILTQIMCGYTLVSFLVLPLIQIYYVNENLEFGLKFNIANFVSRFLALFIGGVLLNLWLAIFLMTIAGIMTYGYTGWRIMRSEGVGGSFIGEVVLRNIARFIPAGIFLIVIKFLGFPSLIIFGSVCAVILAYYGYILIIDKNIRDLVTGIII